MGGNEIGYLLQIFAGIAHCHTHSCFLDDGDIVATIAESHGLFNVQTQIISHSMKSLSLVGSTRRDVGKGRVPSAGSAVFERRHQERFLLYGAERSDLQDGLIAQTIEIGNKNAAIHSQSLAEDFINLVGIMMNSKTALAYHDGRIVVSISSLDDFLHIRRKDGVLAHQRILHKAAGTIGCDVTIDEMLYLTEVMIRNFVEREQLPVVHNVCPADKHTKREEIKQLIVQLQKQYPDLKNRVFGAMQRLPLPEWGVCEGVGRSPHKP